MKAVVILAFLFLCVTLSSAKVFGRCELAKALKNRYGIPSSQIATWVCIANHESHFNTAAINQRSGDHGIFQINQRWWCSTSDSPGKSCNAVCSQFRDDNIGDDVACIKKIFHEHQRISGNGFNAWTTYRPYCQNNVNRFVKGCF